MVLAALETVVAVQLSLPQSDLAQLCAEVIFTLSQPSALANVDLLDIPADELSWYTTRPQPDTLPVA